MDAYQQAVEFLTEHPELIIDSWCDPDNPGGVLFQFADPDGRSGAIRRDDGRMCGCLTQIRRGSLDTWRSVAWTESLTQIISADKRLPWDENEITSGHLPIFAGWQRRIDHLLGRKPPEMDPRIPLPKKEIELVELPELVSA